MKRKIILSITAFLAAIFFTSCLDAIEYISLDENGDIRISFMITMSKSLFEMGGEGESVEDAFRDEVLDPEEISKMIPGSKNAEARLVNSDVDYGYLFTFTLPGDYQPAAGTPMAPHFTGDGIDILLAISEAEPAPAPASGSVKSKKRKPEQTAGNEPMDEMSAAIFSSAKYKVQISKQLLPAASRAYLYSTDGEQTSVDLVDLGDNYLVNLPMLLVMDPEKETHLFFEY